MNKVIYFSDQSNFWYLIWEIDSELEYERNNKNNGENLP